LLVDMLICSFTMKENASHANTMLQEYVNNADDKSKYQK
jgi:hypothetical protein